jgi:peroxiredoxin
LRDDRERFEAAGANVVLIGLGAPDQAERFCVRWRLPFDCLVSPDRKAHRAYGLRRGSFNQLAGPAVWLPWLRNQVTGKPQGAFGQGDPAQLPGTFVVDTGGIVRYAHVGRRSSDNPSNDEVLAAVADLAHGSAAPSRD